MTDNNFGAAGGAADDDFVARPLLGAKHQAQDNVVREALVREAPSLGEAPLDVRSKELGYTEEEIAIKNRDWHLWTPRMRTDWWLGPPKRDRENVARGAMREARREAREREVHERRAEDTARRNARHWRDVLPEPKHVEDGPEGPGCTLGVCVPGCTWWHDMRNYLAAQVAFKRPGRPEGAHDERNAEVLRLAQTMDVHISRVKINRFKWLASLGDSWFDASAREALVAALREGDGFDQFVGKAEEAKMIVERSAGVPLLRFITMGALEGAILDMEAVLTRDDPSGAAHVRSEEAKRIIVRAAASEEKLAYERNKEYNETVKQRRRERSTR